MYYVYIALPLFSFLNGTLFGRWCGQKGSAFLSCCFLGIALLVSILGLYEIVHGGSPIVIRLGEWFIVEAHAIRWILYLNVETAYMCFLIFFVSLSVHIYSFIYMKGDPHVQRFISLLSLFTFFMIVLVTSHTLLQLFVGWEGVGVVSYLLVNFWWTRSAANRGALMALLTNRVGDWGFMIGSMACVALFQTTAIGVCCSVSPYIEQTLLTILTGALVIGVMGKSAQLGLHTWLPHAMEGPTPVSALLHAATLVTAGVFLLLRIAPMLTLCPWTLWFLTLLGGGTAFLGGSLGLVANDYKRVIAFSTCSQLGYMIYAIGISAYSLSLYHLINHGFFKALLFLSAGSVIHALGDEQDLRRMGGIRNRLTTTYPLMVIGSISLMGIPFTTGFYSKEILLSYALGNGSIAGGIGYILCLISAGATTIYSVRAITSGFIKTPMFSHTQKSKGSIQESDPLMRLVLIGLAFMSLVWGYYSQNFFLYSLEEHIYSGTVPAYGCFEYWGGAFAPLVITGVGAIVFFILLAYYPAVWIRLGFSYTFKHLYLLLSKRYRFDLLYNKGITRKCLSIGMFTAYELDKGVGELYGPYGAGQKYITYGVRFGESKIVQNSPIFIGQMFVYMLFILIAVSQYI